MEEQPEYKLGKLKKRFVVTWYEQDRRRRYRLSKGITETQANAELIRFVKSRERLLEREAKTVGDIWGPYLRDRELDGKPTAKQVHSWKALAPIFADVSPTDIDKALCRAYVLGRQKAGKSLGTAWTEMSVLRAALNWARKAKLIAIAPHIFMPDQPKPKERHLRREEAAQLLEAADADHLKLFIRLALATAGRASALLELTWDRVNFITGMIDLRTAEQNRIKRRAIIPMNTSLREALEEARKGALTPCVIEWGGQRVGSIKRSFARAVAKLGWTDVTPHTLRHTAAVWVAEAGESMSVIAQYLGHSDSRITERIYARYSPDYLRRASQALEMPATLH